MASTFSWEIDTLFTYIWETVGETRGTCMCIKMYQSIWETMGDQGRPVCVSKGIKLYQNVLVYQSISNCIKMY